MRLRRISIQWYMVSVVFLAIFLWAGPIVVPDVVRRWKNCERRYTIYQAEALSYSRFAASYAAKGEAEAAASCRWSADDRAMKSWKYRRALFVPWEFWSLGDL